MPGIDHNHLVSNAAVRHDFLLLFDVQDGNPNGDPDANNLPRIDYETMQGLVTDVAIKRKIRDYVALTRPDDPTRQIFVKHRGILTQQQKLAYDATGVDSGGDTPQTVADARAWMCQRFYDVRMFGAVMSTKKYNAGQVRGPVQLTFARSYDPVTPQEVTITRVALTNSEDIKGGLETDTQARSGQIGRKAFVPYGLFRAYGFVNALLAPQTGVDNADLAILWEALVNLWTVDHSASRGLMACRGLYVFSHATALGTAPAQELFELIQVRRTDAQIVPRRFTDYDVTVRSDRLPADVTLTQLVH